MVKGISRQVIVVQSPEPRLFEQAIFILKDDIIEEGVSDDILLREAKRALACREGRQIRAVRWHKFMWLAGGAVLTGCVWLLQALL